MKAQVIIASNRAATGVYEDRTGPIIVDRLTEWGCDVGEPVVVPDGEPVGTALRKAVAKRIEIVITSGGTGPHPNDQTPEQTAAVLERELPGIAEQLRRAGVDKGVPTAMLSRGLAGIAKQTIIVNLPGSPGGVRDGLDVLAPVLHHLHSQIRGGDH